MSPFRPVVALLFASGLSACSAGAIDSPATTSTEGGTTTHPSSTGDSGVATTNPTPQAEAAVLADAGTPITCAEPASDLDEIPPGADSPASAITEGDILDPQSGAKLALYALSAPKTFAPPTTTDPAKQLGLFIAFHEHGGTAKDEVPTVVESLARLKLSGDYVVIGMGQGDETTHGYTKVVDHQIALKLIDWAKKTYPINPRRVYFWGRG